MKHVTVDFDGRRIESVVEARTFMDRLLGLKGVDERTAVVLRLKSIHTVGLKRSLTVVSVGHDGRVNRVNDIPPNRFARFADAQFLIELPAGATVPHVGAEVSVSDV